MSEFWSPVRHSGGHYAAFLISFLVIAAAWGRHHDIFPVRQADGLAAADAQHGLALHDHPQSVRGKLGAVKLKDLAARQVQKALAGLSASLSTRSLRPSLLSTRLTGSLARGEQLHWQPVVDRVAVA